MKRARSSSSSLPSAALLVAGARERRPAHVRRLPRRPELPLRGAARRDARPGAQHERDDRAHARDVGERRPDAPGERRRPVRSRLPVRRSRRARAEHAGARHGGPDHDLGDAEVGERRQDAELHADAAERPDRLRACRRARATPAATRATRSCASTRSGTSRTCSSSSRRSSTSKGKSVAPRNYAKLAAAAYAGIKAGNSTRQGRGRQHLVGRPRQAARGQVGDALAGPLRAARRRRQPAPQVRRVGAAPVSGAGEPEADCRR